MCCAMSSVYDSTATSTAATAAADAAQQQLSPIAAKLAFAAVAYHSANTAFFTSTLFTTASTRTARSHSSPVAVQSCSIAADSAATTP
jgi:hypothetical protein